MAVFITLLFCQDVHMVVNDAPLLSSSLVSGQQVAVGRLLAIEGRRLLVIEVLLRHWLLKSLLLLLRWNLKLLYSRLNKLRLLSLSGLLGMGIHNKAV